MNFNNKSYLVFIKNDDTLFYGPDTSIDTKKQPFKIAKADDHDFDEHVDDYWHYVLFNHKLPAQGWKIHITANLKDAQELLLAVSQYLLEQEISFKFVPTKKDLLFFNSKNADRTESGKFITVYPQSTKQFLALIDSLKEITEPFLPGPYILNDQQWCDSHVFFRYGAFKEMTTVIDGQKVAAIRDNEGNLVEDKRVPYYYVPDFVEVPNKLKQNHTKYTAKDFAPLKRYEIDSAFQFSNAGGVYDGTINGKEVVLKEGRQFAGLDARGIDGYERIENEYNTLVKLKNIPAVVNAYEKFRSWQHLYLVEEYIDGDTLADFITDEYPFNSSKEERQSYVAKCQAIIDKLKIALTQIHAFGIAMGDLQPSNILLLHPDNPAQLEVRLIDFELAQPLDAKYKPAIATPGFADINVKTYLEADNMALYLISRYMFLVIAGGTDFAPEIIQEQNRNLKAEYGPELVNYLEELERQYAPSLQQTSRRPRYYCRNLHKPAVRFSYDNLDQNIQALAKGITNNLDLANSGLIKGDIGQYNDELSHYDVANGAFGGLMALKRAKVLSTKQEKQIKTWVVKQIAAINELSQQPASAPGLYDGLGGIATILYEYGFVNEAENILANLNLQQVKADISIYSGLSGIGLLNLSFYLATGLEKYLILAQKCVEQVLDYCNSHSYDENTDSGLITGWLGAALFLWKFGLATDDEAKRKFAVKILHLVLDNSVEKTSKGVFLKDNDLSYERLMPYLNHGSAGLGLVLQEFKTDDPRVLNSEDETVLADLIKTNDVFLTYMTGLFDGFTGLIVFDQAAGAEQQLQHKLELLNNYLIGQKDQVFMPAKYAFKCSMDLTTGASGLLVTLADLKQSKWQSWLPILFNKQLPFFQRR